MTMWAESKTVMQGIVLPYMTDLSDPSNTLANQHPCPHTMVNIKDLCVECQAHGRTLQMLQFWQIFTHTHDTHMHAAWTGDKSWPGPVLCYVNG